MLWKTREAETEALGKWIADDKGAIRRVISDVAPNFFMLFSCSISVIF